MAVLGQAHPADAAQARPVPAVAGQAVELPALDLDLDAGRGVQAEEIGHPRLGLGPAVARERVAGVDGGGLRHDPPLGLGDGPGVVDAHPALPAARVAQDQPRAEVRVVVGDGRARDIPGDAELRRRRRGLGPQVDPPGPDRLVVLQLIAAALRDGLADQLREPAVADLDLERRLRVLAVAQRPGRGPVDQRRLLGEERLQVAADAAGVLPLLGPVAVRQDVDAVQERQLDAPLDRLGDVGHPVDAHQPVLVVEADPVPQAHHRAVLGDGEGRLADVVGAELVLARPDAQPRDLLQLPVEQSRQPNASH